MVRVLVLVAADAIRLAAIEGHDVLRIGFFLALKRQSYLGELVRILAIDTVVGLLDVIKSTRSQRFQVEYFASFARDLRLGSDSSLLGVHCRRQLTVNYRCIITIVGHLATV